MKTYPDFTSAYVSLAGHLRDNHQFESSPRGQKIKECLGVQFRITNPRNRLPMVSERNFSLTYLVAETLWYLSGSDSTAWISRYAPFWKGISDDGTTANSAYGSRIFRGHSRIGDGKIVQWDYVKSELKKDPDSRRAVIHIRTPSDSILESKDVPCTLSLQFFIREEQLHLHVSMRSSDIILGLAYDVPAFTIMQEIMANELGVGLGEYVHTSNSLHCYERDFEMLNAIASSGDVRGSPMSPLPKMMPVAQLMEFEKASWQYTEAEIRDGIPFTRNDSQIVHDWTAILVSGKARKMKDDRLAKTYIGSTIDPVYHFFTR